MPGARPAASGNALNELADEFRKRRERIAELGGRPGNTEAGTSLEGGYRQRIDAPELDPLRRQARDAGLRAIEMHQGALRADAADRLDDLVRENDPLGLGGRYLEAVANPHYFSAFGKMCVDPTTGHLRFAPQEVEAVRQVAQVSGQRAMSIGVGSAGGFGVPFVLDPSIIMSGSGALNPVRQIATVVQIEGAREWKGVASDGVVAGYVPEATEATEATDGSPTLTQPDIITAQ